MEKGCAICIVTIAFIAVEVLVAQWLLGLFGYRFGFWTVLGIVFAVEFLVGCIFGSRTQKK